MALAKAAKKWRKASANRKSPRSWKHARKAGQSGCAPGSVMWARCKSADARKTRVTRSQCVVALSVCRRQALLGSRWPARRPAQPRIAAGHAPPPAAAARPELPPLSSLPLLPRLPFLPRLLFHRHANCLVSFSFYWEPSGPFFFFLLVLA